MQKWRKAPNGFLFLEAVCFGREGLGWRCCSSQSWYPWGCGTTGLGSSFWQLPTPASGIWRLSECSGEAEEIHLEVGTLEPAPMCQRCLSSSGGGVGIPMSISQLKDITCPAATSMVWEAWAELRVCWYSDAKKKFEQHFNWAQKGKLALSFLNEPGERFRKCWGHRLKGYPNA